MTQPNLHITGVVSFPYQENTLIVNLDGFEDCLIFDPGLEPEKIFACLEEKQLTPAAIMLTHGHSDHIGGNKALKEQWPDCPIVIGRRDADMLSDPVLNLSADYGVEITSPAADVLLDEGDTYTAAGMELSVREIPGHSVGHIVFLYQAHSPWVVFGGDVLFAGSIGRSDFPDGDGELLARGIHEKLFTLPDDTVVFPGHGPKTTIGREKKTNPFVGEPSGYQP